MPCAGIDPTTFGYPGQRSTIELTRPHEVCRSLESMRVNSRKYEFSSFPPSCIFKVSYYSTQLFTWII